ncbi:uncharacterized protein LOC144349666 [Saccoglossus kowalevskii]
MAMVLQFCFALCVVILCGQFSEACSIVGEPKPFIERAQEAKIVVYGEVVAKYPEDGMAHFFPDAYKASLEVFCIFKGGPLQSRINITDMGIMMSCDMTNVDVFVKYILLLAYSPETGKLVPDEINFETAALEVTTDILGALSNLCDVTFQPPHGKDTCPPEVPSKDNPDCDSPTIEVRVPPSDENSLTTSSPPEKKENSTKTKDKDGKVTYVMITESSDKLLDASANTTKVTPNKGRLVSISSTLLAQTWAVAIGVFASTIVLCS